MAYQLTKTTIVRARPSIDAEVFTGFGATKVLLGTGKKFSEDPANVWVNIVVPPGMGDGWIPVANTKEVSDPARPDVDPENFVRQCIIVERSFNVVAANAPWFVSADFLIARAQFETGLTNHGAAAGSDAVGPLLVSSDEWKMFVDNNKPLSDVFGPKDYDYAMLQVYAAAHSMRADAKAISDARAALAPGDPFLPSYLDLFHAHLTDATTALAIRDAESDPAKTLADVLTPTQLTSILARQPFRALTGTTAVKSFVEATEALLNGALKQAYALIKQHAPDELPQAKPGTAVWLGAARSELADNVTEKSQPDRIKSYFAATDFGKVGASIPHWCGAFVAFCINKGNSTIPIPKGSATAANWKQWGQSVPAGSHEIPVGAVVVLTPSPGTNTSGHVAFFTEAPPASSKIKLLGGNQNDSVNETAYPISRIAAVRWFDTEPAGAGAASGIFNMKAAGIPKKFWQFGDLIVDRFGRAGFSTEQQLAALANAIGESGLDPDDQSDPPERSFGLFQCNMKAGLGIGFTQQQLCDPETNIAIIIKEARKFSAFTGAHTVADAVRAFVKFVERPKNPEADIIKRMAIAAKLQRPLT